MAKNGQYAARPRAEVRADLRSHGAWVDVPDCRGTQYANPNTSASMYGVTTGRYDSLAVRSAQANVNRKRREAAWVESTFRYEGLGVRASGRNKIVDPDAGPGRAERDLVDAAVRSGGAGRPRPQATPRGSTYAGRGTQVLKLAGQSTAVTRKASGARRFTTVTK